VRREVHARCGRGPAGNDRRKRRHRARGPTSPWAVPGRAGSSPDKAGTYQRCQMVRVRRASWRGVREEPVLLRPSNLVTGSNLADAGPGAVLSCRVGLPAGISRAGLLAGPGGHGEGLRRTCGDAAGAEPGRTGRRWIRSLERSATGGRAWAGGTGGCDEVAARCNASRTGPGSSADAVRRRSASGR
jgi:hypothetical protein